MKYIMKTVSLVALTVALVVPAMAVDIPSEVTLFKNVNIFDGTSEKLLQGQDVLVVNNLIKQIGKDISTSGSYEIDAKTGGITKKTVSFGGAQGYTIYTTDDTPGTQKKQVKVNVIDGGGRTLMPGLTDAHWHVIYAGLHSLEELRTEEIDYIHARMIKEAGNTLMRGFTTVRDVGGGGFGLKKALDEGVFPGPRILPSGTHLGITGGHADYTESWHPPRRFGGEMDRYEQIESFRKIAGVPDMPGAEEALGPEKFKKFLEMANGFPKTMDFVKKYGIKLSFGTDLSFTPEHNGTRINRAPWV